jgi:hypothetical protein
MGYPPHQLSSKNHLVLAISSTKISWAPTSVKSSIAVAIFFLSTIELTATHSPSPSNALIVGARLPGVICVAAASFVRSTLYWQRTYFWAAGEDKWVSGNQIGELTDNTFYSGCYELNDV